MEVHPGRPRGPDGPDRATRTERAAPPTAARLRPPACRTGPRRITPEGLTARTTKVPYLVSSSSLGTLRLLAWGVRPIFATPAATPAPCSYPRRSRNAQACARTP